MKKYALIVGVSRYDDPEIGDLNFAAQDAREVGACLSEVCGFDEVRTLVSGGEHEPDHISVVEALHNFAPILNKEDLFLFYFAGHGIHTANGSFLLASNSRIRMPELAAVPMPLLQQSLSRLDAAERVLILDACRNDPQQGRGDSDNLLTQEFSRDILAVAKAPCEGVSPAATCVLFSCSEGERAYEWPDKCHGAFTWYLLDGMRGAAHDAQGRLTIQSLSRYVEEQVPRWARKTGKLHTQIPWAQQLGSLRDICLGTRFDVDKEGAITGEGSDSAPVPHAVQDVRVACNAYWDRAAYLYGASQDACVLVEITGNSEGGAAPDLPIHYGLVLDVSGSMNRPDRYPFLVEALKAFLSGIRSCDVVSIALFSGGGDVLCQAESGGATQQGVTTLLERLDRSPVKFGGHTYLAEGLKFMPLVYIQTGCAYTNRCYILTDGEVHDADAARPHIAQLAGMGVELYSYGFGSEFDLTNMRSLFSGVLGGTIKPILSTDEAQATFAHIAHVGSNVMVRSLSVGFTFREGIRGRVFSYHPRIDFIGEVGSLPSALHLGSMEKGRRYRYCLEVSVPAVPRERQAENTPLGDVIVDTDGTKLVVPLAARRTNSKALYETRTDEVLDVRDAVQFTIADSNEARKASIAARVRLMKRERCDPVQIADMERRLERLDQVCTESGLACEMADDITRARPADGSPEPVMERPDSRTGTEKTPSLGKRVFARYKRSL